LFEKIERVLTNTKTIAGVSIMGASGVAAYIVPDMKKVAVPVGLLGLGITLWGVKDALEEEEGVQYPPPYYPQQCPPGYVYMGGKCVPITPWQPWQPPTQPWQPPTQPWQPAPPQPNFTVELMTVWSLWLGLTPGRGAGYMDFKIKYWEPRYSARGTILFAFTGDLANCEVREVRVNGKRHPFVTKQSRGLRVYIIDNIPSNATICIRTTGEAVVISGEQGKLLCKVVAYYDDKGTLIPGYQPIWCADKDLMDMSCAYALPITADLMRSVERKVWSVPPLEEVCP